MKPAKGQSRPHPYKGRVALGKTPVVRAWTRTNHEQIAWAAGLYCGEGSCHWVRNGTKYGRPSMEITQCGSPEVLETFNSAVNGLLNLYGPYTNRANTHRQYWQLSTTNLGAIQTVMGAMWPWLSQAKKDQFAALMHTVRDYAARPKHKPWDIAKGRANV